MQAEEIVSVRKNVHIEIAYGRVQGLLHEGQYVLLSEDGELRERQASCAFSCLVQPETGDRVMFSHADGEAHILAVIDRPQNKDTTLSFSGDVILNTQQGKLSITGKQGVQIASAGALSLISDELDVIANKGVVNVGHLSAIGDQFNSHIKRLKTFAETIDIVAKRWSQRLVHSFRQIEGVDQTKAGDILTTIKNLFSLRARQAAILAKKDIKIDAERIHMG